MTPSVGQKIEFKSDQLTDKGPATGTIADTKVTVDGLYVTVEFADSQEMFSWDDLREAGADVRGDLWMVKAHIKGYSRRDGVYVQPHDRDTGVAAAAAPVHHHPRTGEAGEQVEIKRPSHASLPSTWHNPDAVATFVPGGDVPASLNGVSLTAWKDHPRTSEGWDFCDGINEDLYEPPFHLPPGKKAAAGVVIEEPDGRCWVVHPTNAFGNYQVTWPKGTCEPGLSMQGNALKETYEEAGLKIEITGFIGDFERTTSKARMYRAKRIGGTPTAMGWESQAVSLCPRGLLYDMLNMYTDFPIAETIGAGPAPAKPSKPQVFASNQKKLF